MAMSVAERIEIQRGPANPRLQLGLASLVGGALILLALWTLFAGLPLAWEEVVGSTVNPFLSGALLLITSIVLAFALGYAAYHLEKSFSMPGLRAGTFFAAVGLYLVAWLTVS